MAGQPSPAEMKALEQTRQRIAQLSSNIASLKLDILRTTPLPTWESLETTASIIGHNLQSLSAHLAAHNELFQQTVVYPCTNYPGREQEMLLGQLLRKKVEPGVEDWIEEGKREGTSEGEGHKEDLSEFWNEAQDWLAERVLTFVRDEQNQEYTKDEIAMGIENVNTGLRDQFESDEDAMDEDDEEVKDELAVTSVRRASAAGGVSFEMSKPDSKSEEKKGKSLDEVLRFVTRGDTTGPQQAAFRR
jgi:mediator of RNA polymerase II transcription subunit 8